MRFRSLTKMVGAVGLCALIAGCGDSSTSKRLDTGGGNADTTIDISVDLGGNNDITVDNGLFGDSTVDSSLDGQQQKDIAVGDTTRDGGGSGDSTSDGGNLDTTVDSTVDGITASICGSSTVLLAEIAVGQPDYVVLKNYGSAAVDIKGFKLEMTGISPSSPDTYTFANSVVIQPGATQYIFEDQSGTKTGDINTGANIPFYDGLPGSPNAVSLYDASGKLVDYWAVIKAVNLPAGAAYAAGPYPTGFTDPALHSVQRKSTATASKCPNFDSADYVSGAITRP